MFANKSTRLRVGLFLIIILVVSFMPGFALAEEAAHTAEAEGHGINPIIFLWVAILLIAAKVSSLVERWGQPAVLGEIVIGIILGNLVLVGIDFFEPITHEAVIAFIAEMGAVLLLYQIGLESNIKEVAEVGGRSLAVALIGMAIPFLLGAYVLGPWLLPESSSLAHMFLGGALTANSIGITMRIFKDLGKMKTVAARTILGASVIDDIGGLIILAVISALAISGSVTFGLVMGIIVKAILFLGLSVTLGSLASPHISRIFARINTGQGMKFALVISAALVFAYLAKIIGLEPIVGAFAAGLFLDPVHFFAFKDDQELKKDIMYVQNRVDRTTGNMLNRVMYNHSHRHVEDFVEHLSHFFVPVFFVTIGMTVDLSALFNSEIIVAALIVSVFAFISKFVAGIGARPGNKLMVGVGMIPRGEVGLIFATVGLGLGVVNDELFAIIVAMVLATTLLTPPLLSWIARKKKA